MQNHSNLQSEGRCKDGSVYEKRRQRYICCNKARNSRECEGQSVYASNKIDGAIVQIVNDYLARIKTTAKSVALEKRYQTEIAERKAEQRELSQENRKLKDSLAQLSAEISKSLTGDSSFTPDMLSMAIENMKAELQKSDDKLAQLNYEINNSQGAMKKLDHYYDQFNNWASEFGDATLEERKMIVCNLIREVKVSRGYELDVVMDMNYEQFLSEGVE